MNVNKKRDEYLNFAKEKKGNMKVTVIITVIGVLETIPKYLEKRFDE